MGLLLTVVTLLLGIAARNYEGAGMQRISTRCIATTGYENCVPKVIAIMERLKRREVPSEYTYHQIPSPWLQV